MSVRVGEAASAPPFPEAAKRMVANSQLRRNVRHATDVIRTKRGRVVVLHETVSSLNSAINTFKTPHPRDEDQVSYHTLVGLNGEIVETVPAERRAFGAGYSAFNGQWAVTNPAVGGSINNFALHLSLETPEDGEDEEGEHSGYTAAQYDAAALVLADWIRRFRISPRSITTHRHVDLGGARADPRSLDWTELGIRLASLGVLC